MLDIDTEINHVRTYLEIEKARFEEKLRVEINVEDGLSCQVPSFILQPIVENAFKHGISPTERSFIHIHLAENETEVICEISNSNHPKNIMDKSGSGIGLEQVNRRLEILYPGQYTWQKGISEDGKEYRSRLSIRVRESINK